MSFKIRIASAFAGAGVILSAAAALAHVSASGPAIAGKRHIVTLGVGHGCGDTDTYRVEVSIPENVTEVRALPSPWGEAELTRNDADLVTAVTWTKSESRPADDQYYEFAIRIAVPDAPFTRLYLPTTQYCRTEDGEELSTAWSATIEDAESEDAEPAPWVWIVPERKPGWNKYTVERKITDLSVFDDAQIVWAGDAAYSSNPATKELIESDDDVEELTEIPAKTEIWVKY